MKTSTRITVASLALALALINLSPGARAHAAAAQAAPAVQPSDTLQRGYRTGYSDGYQSGWSDSASRAPRDYRGKEEYKRADRVYAPAYGELEIYRDGYRQGFEAGYEDGYAMRRFDSTVPTTLARRGVSGAADDAPATANNRTDDDDPANVSESTSSNRRSAGTSSNVPDDDRDADYNGPQARGSARRTASGIPAGTILRVELANRLSSDISQRGDPFEARVVEPREYEGAIVSGRVTSVRRAGKVRGVAELQLSFDQIRLAGGGFEDFSAQVVEVVGSDEATNVGKVDPEGGVRGRDTTKDDVAKVGASAGIGAIIGAIAGGGKGAGIGAAIGGAVGAGGVMTQRGKDIRLERGQQLVIRTAR